MTNKEWLSTLSAEEWYKQVWWLFHEYGTSYTDSYLAIIAWLDEEHTERSRIDTMFYPQVDGVTPSVVQSTREHVDSEGKE